MALHHHLRQRGFQDAVTPDNGGLENPVGWSWLAESVTRWTTRPNCQQILSIQASIQVAESAFVVMERQAVVTLFPVGEKEALPFRSLTFTAADDTFRVGRASRREEKNMVPEHHNAYFDSRVMSRQHATLGVSTDMKTVYIRDSGSMHGTFVNDKKIASDKNCTIRSGDVMTFGTSVTRGNETFKPLKVRCEYEWFDDRHDRVSKPDIEKKTNKFSVPEDDDDVEVVEVIDTTIMADVEDAGSVDDHARDSALWSDDEEDAVAEQSSPVTSPSSEHFIHGKGEAEVTGEPDDDELPMISICHQTSTSVAGPKKIATAAQHEETRVAVCPAESSSEPADSDHVSDKENDVEQPDDQSDVAPDDEADDPSNDENEYSKVDELYEEIFSAAADLMDATGSAHAEYGIDSAMPKFTGRPEMGTDGTQRATTDSSLPKHSFDCPPMQTPDPPLSVYKDGPFVDGAALAHATSAAANKPFPASDDLGSTKQNNLSHESHGSKSAEVSTKFRQSQGSEATGIGQTVNPVVCLSSPSKPTKQQNWLLDCGPRRCQAHELA